jgi:hypothetical protein
VISNVVMIFITSLLRCNEDGAVGAGAGVYRSELRALQHRNGTMQRKVLTVLGSGAQAGQLSASCPHGSRWA